MDGIYDNGLDDFDRDLLGHNALQLPHRIQHFNHLPNQQNPINYFPSPRAPNSCELTDGYGINYENVLLPYPLPHSQPVYQHVFPASPQLTAHRGQNRYVEDRRQSFSYPVPQAAFQQTPPSSSHFTRTETAQHRGLLTGSDVYEPGPRSSSALSSNFQLPASSSPTTRISPKKKLSVPATSKSKPLESSATFPSCQAQGSSLSNTPVIHGIPLVSLRQALPEKFRAIFPFELFNAVQSKCFSAVYETNDNVVIAAPTGSGKTAILELAICKLALDRGSQNFKIVYQAPTKALCSEKARDWEKKFAHMNLKCAELTGDTSHAEMKRVSDASIIVTTPEKWDSVTRKWQDHQKLLQMVELFLIDEVHILKDVRGATLEAVVSRMKTIGANVRFIALSATVPNSEDIAQWLGRNNTNQQLPAHREVFREEFRPVKLQKFVYGFDHNGNDFTFDKFLDQKLPSLLSRHSQRKPILIFCFTRKSCETTATMLADYAASRSDSTPVWPIPNQRIPVISKELQEIIHLGVAFHHAGLDSQDRTIIEKNFLKGQIGVICCTSTLAVGINLPCHTVVLKGTVCFADEKLEEYSDLEVMQMLGRAGRPQFDDSATAIILTRNTNRQRYEKMVSGHEILESTLHLHLIEHLNSEICLGTINSLESAKIWLSGTFLSVRLRKNPKYYQLTGSTTSPSQIDENLEKICERDIRQLQDAKMVTDGDIFWCTEYGRAMSKYMVEFNTMKLLLQIPRAASMEVLITVLSQATEFKDFRFKPNERALFREVNQSPLILYPIKENVTQLWHKISLMLQAHLGCVQYPDSVEFSKIRRQLHAERRAVFERLGRLVRAVIDCKGYDRDAIGTRNALELARALAAESWEGRATQLIQVPQIGPVGMRKLASRGIRSVLELADKDYDEIERLMSRQPPFGKDMKAHLDKFPRLDMDLEVVDRKVVSNDQEPVLIEVKATLRYLNRKGPPTWLNRWPALTFFVEAGKGVLAFFWRGSMKKLNPQSGHELRFAVGLHEPQDRVICYFTCEEIVGTIVSKTLQHNVPASVFPTRLSRYDTTPRRRSYVDEIDDPDNDGLDDADLIMAEERAMALVSKRQPPEQGCESVEEEYPPVEKVLNRSSSRNQPITRVLDDHWSYPHDTDEDKDNMTVEYREPVKLPNGKWQCNHPCSGGTYTKSGRPCTHKCCKEGLDKPRRRPFQHSKRKRSDSNTKKSAPVDSNESPLSQLCIKQAFERALSTTEDFQAKRVKANYLAPSNLAKPFPPQFFTWTIANCRSFNEKEFKKSEADCIDLSWTDDEDDLLAIAIGNGLHTPTETKTMTSAASNAHRAADVVNQKTGKNPVDKRTKDVSSVELDPDWFDDDLESLFGDEVSRFEGLRSTGSALTSKTKADFTLHDKITCNTTERHGGFPSVPQGCSKTDLLPGSHTQGASHPQARSIPSEETSDEIKVGSFIFCQASLEQDSLEQQIAPATSDEPAWLAEFDPELVDMFRGYVTFVD